MNFKMIYYIGIILGFCCFASCNEFLDTIPDNRTEIDNVDAVGELLVSAYPSGSYMMFAETMSDNVSDKGTGASYNATNEDAYFWSEKFSDDGQDTPEYYWTNSYEAIAASNQALLAIEELGDTDEAMPYKGEALLSRAYAHFMLVNFFAKAYDPNTAESDLGVPYVLEPETVILKDYKRETVARVYELIKKDLEEGLPLIQNKVYDVPKYHFNQSAAHAFASRFYLYMGDWEKVLEHTNKVLSTNPSRQMRDWVGEYNVYTYYELRAQYTHSEESANLLLAGQATWWGRNLAGKRYSLASSKTKEIFNLENIAGGSWAYKIYGQETSNNIPKLEEHFKYTSINATTGVGYVMSPLFTIEEVLLNRAEALVMLNQSEDAIEDMNTFLSKRIKYYDPAVNTVDATSIKDFYTYMAKNEDYKDDYVDYTYTPFYQISDEQLPLLKAVLDLRRVEFVHEGLRWFDNRRFHMEINHYINNGKGENDEEDILLPNDPRRECQIPELAIEFGLEANPR